ncbi:MauE/DoxX family redox-associated membrane protein [Corallococcus exercitus]|uniref:DoxX family membrane protein n=1 Tax=Corallococcus exercitus TaxID=2316736 RepID=A0A7Y4JSK3_9BACT|nr:MauE/DoxX family redox-associated membrane protein [Corallococcus exercitus]NOK10410.1 DoxX family membrane protein [Corallococcus exercitus]
MRTPSPESGRLFGLTDGEAGYALLRITLGLNILLHGVVRLVGGPGAFADGLVKAFETSLLPGALVRPFAWVLPFAETAVGALLLLGLLTRHALAVGGLLMLALVFGTALRSEWEMLSVQMLYVGLYAALLGTARFNALALDRLRLSAPAATPRSVP